MRGRGNSQAETILKNFARGKQATPYCFGKCVQSEERKGVAAKRRKVVCDKCPEAAETARVSKKEGAASVRKLLQEKRLKGILQEIRGAWGCGRALLYRAEREIHEEL